jgi:hypothetical protein
MIWRIVGAVYGGVNELANLEFGHIPLLEKEGNSASRQFIHTFTDGAYSQMLYKPETRQK